MSVTVSGPYASAATSSATITASAGFSGHVISGNYVTTTGNINTSSNIINGFGGIASKSVIDDSTYFIDITRSPYKFKDYPQLTHNSRIFVENDMSDSDIYTYSAWNISDKKLMACVFAIDLLSNRLEICSVLPNRDFSSSLDKLITPSMQIVKDRSEYIKSLYSRFMPSVNVKSEDTLTTSSQCSGILPFMHLSNLVFTGLKPVSHNDVLTVFQHLSAEVVVYDKERFPQIQPMFSPEYGYISLDTSKDLLKISRKQFKLTDDGLISLLKQLSVPGTKVIPFATCLLANIGLDQLVINPARVAINTIRFFIESHY